jgi:uncharacterized protein YicC (UPF0701 family)
MSPKNISPAVLIEESKSLNKKLSEIADELQAHFEKKRDIEGAALFREFTAQLALMANIHQDVIEKMK